MDRERAEQRRAWLVVALMIVSFVWALGVNHMLGNVVNAVAVAQAAGKTNSEYWPHFKTYYGLALALMAIQLVFGYRFRRITDNILFENNASWDGLREFSGWYGLYLWVLPIVHMFTKVAAAMQS